MTQNQQRKLHAALLWAMNAPVAPRTRIAAVAAHYRVASIRHLAWCIGVNPSSLCRAAKILKKHMEEKR